MPTYEYECTKCGHKFELFQRMKDEPITECPRCSRAVKRLIGSGAGIIFKGSGFYATDYKRKRSKPNVDACPNASKDNPSCESCSAKPDGK